MIPWRFLAALPALLLAALAAAPAASATDLQGQVTVKPLASHAPPAGALLTQPAQLVTLIDARTGAIVARTYTSPAGAYTFTGIAAGSYQVQVGFPAAQPGPIMAVSGGIVQSLPPLVVGTSR